MPADTQTTIDTRQKLKEAVWADLSRQSWSQISLDTIAGDLLIEPAAARLSAGSKAELVLEMLSDLDRHALSDSYADFAEDADASMHDKLLEGILHRFEIYQPYKSQMRHLHEAAIRDPKFGMKLINSLTMAADQLLFICGDEKASINRRLRVKGLTAVIMSVRSDWQDDASSDMAKTMKILDKRLKQAAEWAESFRLV